MHLHSWGFFLILWANSLSLIPFSSIKSHTKWSVQDFTPQVVVCNKLLYILSSWTKWHYLYGPSDMYMFALLEPEQLT